jgi:hypothetical protein
MAFRRNVAAESPRLLTCYFTAAWSPSLMPVVCDPGVEEAARRRVGAN